MTLLDLLDDLVFRIVVVTQLCILGRCLFLALASDSEALDGLRGPFEDDIRGRARRGDGPDWVRYMDEADRVHERRIDRLRVWATGALVARPPDRGLPPAIRGRSSPWSGGTPA